MWNVIANQEYQTIDLTWMAWTPWLPFLIAHITIAWEVFFIVLVWNRRLRPLMLAMGTAMHVGIGAFLGMWTFGLIMTFAYLSFADPEIWRAVLRAQQSLASPQVVRAFRHVARRRVAARGRSGVADSQNSSSQRSTVTALTTECRWSRTTLPRCHVAHPVCSVLVIATDAQHRSALREHFRGHAFDCRAVDSGDRAMHLLHRQQYSAIVIHGSGYFRTDLLSLVSDVLDYGNVPVLVLLAGSQNTLASHFDTRADSRSVTSFRRRCEKFASSLESLLARVRESG